METSTHDLPVTRVVVFAVASCARIDQLRRYFGSMSQSSFKNKRRMIDPLEQRQNCPCAECRAKRYELLCRGENRIPKSALRRRALPVRHAHGIGPVCPPAISSCRNPPAGFPASSAVLSKTITDVGLPSSPMLNFYPIDSSPDVHNTMQFCKFELIDFPSWSGIDCTSSRDLYHVHPSSR